MTREKAIEILEDICKEYSWGETIEACKMGAEALRNAPRWISVKERLPNEGDDVAAFDKHGCKDALFFKYGKFYSIYGNWHKDVTHWMPLPSPNQSEKPTSSEIPNNCEKGGEDEK